MKIFILASGAALLAAASTDQAAAQTSRSFAIEQVKVQHGDLDLATEIGADAMLGRLNDAASNACGRKPIAMAGDPLAPLELRMYWHCRVAAVDAATLLLNAPLVRAAWLDSDEAIRFGEEARRTTSKLLGRAGVDESAGQRQNY